MDVVAIERADGRTRLKWHRAKRRLEDVPFTAGRIREGFRAGASFEVDVNPHGDGGFLVIHDDRLDRETTGSGPTREARLADLRRLAMRSPDGAPTGEPLMVLSDLGTLAAGADCAPGAVCQIDLKVDVGDFDDGHVAGFAAALRGAADRFVLSGGDPAAVLRLAEATPGLAVGFDPCHGPILDRFLAGDAAGFVRATIEAMPSARIVYLHWRLVTDGLDRGHDVVDLFHAEGREIDAYTVNLAVPEVDAVLARLLATGVDQITTDEPTALAMRAEALGLGTAA